ncbi:MAG TPA: S53 family peptidase, partial [Solirubrobacteraceae bacterium]|nr:S53 family peptidase [Solirubrobacteraceae bacterium]
MATLDSGMAPGLRKARLWTPITALALVMLIWCSAAGASDGHVARPRQLRVGSAPVLPHGSRSLGALAQGTRISALIALKPRAGLGAYAREVTTPGSALFHHYLTVKGFRARFGDTAATIGRVQRALRSVGLSAGRISGNGLVIPVTGSAAQLGRAFKTSFRRVQLDSGRVAYANTVAPDLPAAIAPAVMGVFGLSSVARPQATVLHARAGAVASRERAGRVEAHDSTGTGPQACSSAVGAADAYGGYTDTQVAATYGFDSLYAQGDLGAGQTIALYEAEPDLVSDIATFQSCYGTDTTVNYIPVDGGVGTGAGEGEAALDIEQIISLAPQATIDVYQDGGGTYGSWIQTYTEMADNPLVDAISTSWGIGCEVGFSNFEQDENIVFEQIAVEGKSAFAASGDNGSAGDCDGSLLDATDPASQPYVTATGGTSLFAPDPAYQTAWNESSDSEGGGGGGVSVMWPMPSYQSAAPASLGVISSYSARVASFVNDYPPADESSCVADAETGTYCREVPDVSANADPETGYAIYWTGGEPTYPAWGQIAGTSAAAPLWAAYTALANDSQTCNGAAIGFANPLLYEAAGNQGTYSADFTQITSGDNDYTGDSDFDGEYGGSGVPVSFTGGLYPATAGYNMATGLGTPVGGPLATTLCDENDTVTLSNPGNQSGKVGTAVNLVASATDNEQHALTFSAT